MSNQITVNTNSAASYNYHVGTDLLDDVSAFIDDNIGSDKVFVVIDKNVYQHHIERINKAFQSRFKKMITYVVPPGEKSKSYDQFGSIVDFVLNQGVERTTPLIAIGGGVVGDLAGFVAASVMRGIPLIQVPTSLLAMVDSSIGGKTGINHSTGKNLIGAFYQPKAVYADLNFLTTLPEKEWVNGLSEIIKYGMIENPDILNQLQRLISENGFTNPEQWQSMVEHSAQIKVDIVSRDVHEQGIRAFLNFGHTYAHVIERIGNYMNYSHGEAVFAGMYGAVYASNQLGASIDPNVLNNFKSLYKFKLSDIAKHCNEFPSLMRKDKKAKNEQIRLVLLKELGNPYVKEVDDMDLISASWEDAIGNFS